MLYSRDSYRTGKKVKLRRIYLKFKTIAQQGKKVGEKFYMTEWYQLPHKTALGLVLIISRSSMVIKITAGKLIQISIATFAAVSIDMKTFSV